MSKNYKLKSGNYLKIDKTDEGYEYSLYEECKRLIDGGILENPKLNDMVSSVIHPHNIHPPEIFRRN